MLQAWVDQNIAEARKTKDVPWTTITGDINEAKAKATAMSAITKALQGSGPWSLFKTGALGAYNTESPIIPYTTQQQLLTALKSERYCVGSTATRT